MEGKAVIPMLVAACATSHTAAVQQPRDATVLGGVTIASGHWLRIDTAGNLARAGDSEERVRRLSELGFSVGSSDEHLERVANLVAEELAEGGVASNRVLELLARAAGVPAPLHVYIARGTSPVDDLRRQLAAAGSRGDTLVGLASAGSVTVLAVRNRPSFDIDQIPRAVSGRFTLSGVSRRPGGSIVVTVADDRNRVSRPSAVDEHGRFSAQVGCLGRGAEWVTVAGADATDGLAQFSVSCTDPPPTSVEVVQASSVEHVAPARMSQTIQEILNREREDHHLPLFTTRPILDAIAAQLARRASRSPSTPAPHWNFQAVSWTAFHADDLADGVELILNDADLRKRFLDPQKNQIGANVYATPQDGIWISVVIAKSVPVIVPADVQRDLERRLQDVRPKAEVGTLARDSVQAAANALAVGWSQNDVIPGLTSASNTSRRHSRRIWSAVVATDDPTTIDVGAMAKARFSAADIAVAQSSLDGVLVGTIWVVALFAD